MAKFCGICGSKLDEKTGLCPNCDSGHPAPQEISKPQKLTRKEKKAIKKANMTSAQKVKRVLLKILAILLVVLVLFWGTLGVLAYNRVIDIPVLNKLFELFGVKKTGGSSGGGDTPTSPSYACVDGSFVTVNITDEQSAREAVKQAAEPLGITDVDSKLGACEVVTLPDEKVYRFEQVYNGVPVYENTIAVSADENGGCTMISSSYQNVDGVNMDIEVNESAALEILIKQYGADSVIERRGKYIYTGAQQPVQVWVFDVRNVEVGETCFVSTASGEIVGTVSNVYTTLAQGTGRDVDNADKTFNTNKIGDTYYLEDIVRDIVIFDAQNSTLTKEYVIVDSNNKVYKGKDGKWVDEKGKTVSIPGDYPPFTIYDENGNEVGTNAVWGIQLATINIFTTVVSVTSKSTNWDNARAVTLMTRLEKIYDFWQTNYLRRGFDDHNGRTVGVFNDYMGGDTGNAYSYTQKDTGISLLSFQKDNKLTYDVIGHEYMHSVERSVSGMNYSGESGALMEAYSDIFGEIVEDWQDDDKLNNSCDWFHYTNRDLVNPKTKSKPDYYRGEYWVDTSSGSDNGGVHTNNSVISHAAYLMCNTDGDDHELSPLSVKNVSDLFFYSLANITDRDCSFHQFTDILLKRAQTMLKNGKLSYKQYLCVEDSLRKVGLLPGYTQGFVAKNFDLSVLGLNESLYNNYHLKITGIDTSSPPISGWNLQIKYTGVVLEEDVTQVSPKSITLDEGIYMLEVTDNANANKTRKIALSVTEHGNNALTVFTDFGSGDTYVSGAERDVVLVLDVSGSMEGEPIDQTKKASTKFIDTVLANDANIGIVTYNSDAQIVSPFSTDGVDLKNKVDSFRSGGATNIEDGLRNAESMLSAGNANKKIIVLMSDGMPNRGKEGEELIAYAEELKEQGIYIYTLGFFESLSDKSSAQYLLEKIASEGCHYEVSDADSLVFFFGDIADQINGQKFIYVRIACPVDVSVTYQGETLNSSDKSLNTRTSFGSLTFEEAGNYYGGSEDGASSDDTVKILRLKEGVDYDVNIVGTGSGRMNYSIGFMDEEGEYKDFRRFYNIRINRRTKIDTVAEVSDSTTLNVDEDGDGRYDIKYRAGANGYGKQVKDVPVVFIVILVVGVLLLAVALVIAVKKIKKKRTV